MVRTLVRHRGAPLRRLLRVRAGPGAGLLHRGAHAEAAAGRPRAERTTRAGVVRAVAAPECRGRGKRMAEVRARGGGSRAGSDAAWQRLARTKGARALCRHDSRRGARSPSRRRDTPAAISPRGSHGSRRASPAHQRRYAVTRLPPPTRLRPGSAPPTRSRT